jgi:putative SOS response-associated peptidase YedK
LTEKTKQPYAFTLKGREPFAFAGLWDAWKEPTSGDWLQSFAIVTTEPNELTATVHDRMPVILKRSDYDRWLARDEAERSPVDLLKSYEAGEMTAYPVDPRVGNVRNNEQGLCAVWQGSPKQE